MKSILTAIAASSLLAIAQSPTYIVTDLGPVGGAPGQPFTISNRDMVAGAAVFADGSSHAVLWYKGWQGDLGKTGLGGTNSVAFSGNTWGQAVGQAETSTLDPHGEDFCGFKAMGNPTMGAACVPFIWQDGVMNALETLGGNNGAANMINNRSEVVGVAETTVPDGTCPPPLTFQFKPVLWGIGSIHQLPTFPGDPDGIAHAINDNGQIVGASGVCAAFNPGSLVNFQPLHALLWQNGVATDLGNLGGTGQFQGNMASGINSLGQVVGNSDLPGNTASHAFLWTKEKGMQDLGTLPGDFISIGVNIGDSGEVIGLSLDANFNPTAFLWRNGVMTDLNALIPAESPWYLLLACGINASGEIVGLAVDKNTGEAHGYLASPKPGVFDGQLRVSHHKMVLPENVRAMVRQRFGHK